MPEPFTGEHELSLDDKKRLMVPREIRDMLPRSDDGVVLYVVVSPDRRLHLYTQTRFSQLCQPRASALEDDPQTDDRQRLLFGLSSPVKVDTVGRITLTDKQLKRTSLTREVTLVGNGDHLEVWNRDDWEAESERLLAERERQYREQREARRTSKSAGVSSGVSPQGMSQNESPKVVQLSGSPEPKTINLTSRDQPGSVEDAPRQREP